MKNEFDYIEKLVKLVNDNDLTELSIEEGEGAIIIKRENAVTTAMTVPAAAPMLPSVVQPAPMVSVNPPAQAEAAPPASNLVKVTAPMVGTFYGASSPGSDPFASVGKNITKGQVICIIEAMKLMNEIESEVTGKVVEILVEDGQPVEYGQVMMMVEPS